MKLRSPQQIEETLLELQPEEWTTKPDFEIQKVGQEPEDSEVEQIEVICCEEIKISSLGLLTVVQPAVLGEYTKLLDSPSGPIYRKKDSSGLYISKPLASKKVRPVCLLSYSRARPRCTAGG